MSSLGAQKEQIDGKTMHKFDTSQLRELEVHWQRVLLHPPATHTRAWLRVFGDSGSRGITYDALEFKKWHNNDVYII